MEVSDVPPSAISSYGGYSTVYLFESYGGGISILHSAANQDSVSAGTLFRNDSGGTPWYDPSSSLNHALGNDPSAPFSLGTKSHGLFNNTDFPSGHNAIAPLFLQASVTSYAVNGIVIVDNGTLVSGSMDPNGSPGGSPQLMSFGVGNETIDEFALPWTWGIQNVFPRGSDQDVQMISIPAPAGICWVSTNTSSLAIQRLPGGLFGTGLAAISPSEGPTTQFPYTRLAVMTADNATSFYLYHQINSTTFVEESWESSTDIWVPPVYVNINTN